MNSTRPPSTVARPQCPICAGEQAASVMPFRHGSRSTAINSQTELLRCGACRFVFSWPRRFESTTPFKRYFEPGTGNNIYDFAFPRALGQFALVSRYLTPSAVAHVLEVGPGHGLLLEEFIRANPAVQIAVMEQDASAISRFRDAGCTVLTELLGAQLPSSLSEQRFDLAILSQILQFVPEPVAALKAVRAALAPQGVLFVEVPNFEVMAEVYSHFDAALNFFSVDSLRHSLEAAGYDVLFLDTVGRTTADLRGVQKPGSDRLQPASRFLSRLWRMLYKKLGVLNVRSRVLQNRVSSLGHFSYGGDRIWIRAVARPVGGNGAA